MENLPSYISLVFGITVLLALAIFYKASNKSKAFLLLSSVWIIIQTSLSLNGFYKITNTVPPRFPLLFLPPILLIVFLLITQKGKEFIERLDLKTLTILHIIRIPVEIVLIWLATYKAVPILMTFEGRNFDIISGLSAPLIYYFGFVEKKLSKSFMLIWNFICLGLLLNIVFTALLSAPTNFQKFAFNQPNIAIEYFPFVLLPSVIVPLVLFSHVVSIRKLLSKG